MKQTIVNKPSPTPEATEVMCGEVKCPYYTQLGGVACAKQIKDNRISFGKSLEEYDKRVDMGFLSSSKAALDAMYYSNQGSYLDSREVNRLTIQNYCGTLVSSGQAPVTTEISRDYKGYREPVNTFNGLVEAYNDTQR